MGKYGLALRDGQLEDAIIDEKTVAEIDEASPRLLSWDILYFQGRQTICLQE